MFDLASIVTYVGVVIGLFLIPGPAVLLVITRTFIHPESGSSLSQFAVLGLIFSGLSAVYTSLISITIRPFLRCFSRRELSSVRQRLSRSPSSRALRWNSQGAVRER